MDQKTTVGILAWLFRQFGGRKMTIFLATYGGIIYTVAQMAQGHVTGGAYTAISVLLGVLAALGVGTSVAIAHEDGARAKAAALVEGAQADAQAAASHVKLAEIQLGAAPAAMDSAFKRP